MNKELLDEKQKEELNNELFMISNQFDKYFNELLKLD